jgi:hypothetical protein
LAYWGRACGIWFCYCWAKLSWIMNCFLAWGVMPIKWSGFWWLTSVYTEGVLATVGSSWNIGCVLKS